MSETEHVRKTILVIEDETALLQAIKKKLEISSFSVITARTVEQGLNYIEEIGNIGAIWLDHYLLGKEDGLDFVQKIKGDNKHKMIPIFVVSNTASPDKVKSYLDLGVQKFFTKADFRLDEIISEISEFMEKK